MTEELFDKNAWLERIGYSGPVHWRADARHRAAQAGSNKPYAASGAYINRMSDFCRECSYAVHEGAGPRACPFNYLYWAFLIRHERQLARNPRLAMAYRNLAKWPSDRRDRTVKEADEFLDRLQ